jgi:hypothetical protein
MAVLGHPAGEVAVTAGGQVTPHAWAVRARPAGGDEIRIYTRNHAFGVGQQASLRESDSYPSAIEYLLGALAADLLRGFGIEAARRQVAVHAGEVNLEGRLNNVLVHLGVVGEEGHPGLETIGGTLYVSADCDDGTLDELWRAALARSPLFHTLSRAAAIRVEIRSMP